MFTSFQPYTGSQPNGAVGDAATGVARWRGQGYDAAGDDDGANGLQKGVRDVHTVLAGSQTLLAGDKHALVCSPDNDSFGGPLSGTPGAKAMCYPVCQKRPRTHALVIAASFKGEWPPPPPMKRPHAEPCYI